MRSLSQFAAISLTVSILCLVPQPVAADTQYHSTGVGKTYQNNPYSSCWWWDLYHNSGDPCYQGIWSDTQVYNLPALALVEEWGEAHFYSCFDWHGITCTDFYNRISPIPSSLAMVGGYATTNHYHCGWYSCSYKVNVRGWADHQDVTHAGGVWTTSDGY